MFQLQRLDPRADTMNLKNSHCVLGQENLFILRDAYCLNCTSHDDATRVPSLKVKTTNSKMSSEGFQPKFAALLSIMLE